MKFKGSWLAISLAVVALGGCGGGGGGADSLVPSNQGGVTRIVAFGDSLSDPGAYALAAAEKGGGRFTVNGTDSKVWTELVARDYGIVLVPNQIVTDLGPSINPAGTSYAEGGARTNPRSASPLERNGLSAFPDSTKVLGILANPDPRNATGSCTATGLQISRFGLNPNAATDRTDPLGAPIPGNPANLAGCIVQTDLALTDAQRTAINDDAGIGFFVSNGSSLPIGLTAFDNGYARTGLTTKPISKQIESFLNSNPSGNGSTLITYLGGANDLLLISSAYAAAFQNAVVTRATAGMRSTPNSDDVSGAFSDTNASRNNLLTLSAQVAVQVAKQLKQLQVAGYSKILVSNMPDIGKTPAFSGTLVSGVISSFSDKFNEQLAACLSATSATPTVCVESLGMATPVAIVPAGDFTSFDADKVKVFDTKRLFDLLIADLTATTKQFDMAQLGPACKPEGFRSSRVFTAKTTTSSLFCNSGDVVTGANIDQYIFADSVHPTPKTHALFAQAVINELKTFKWR